MIGSLFSNLSVLQVAGHTNFRQCFASGYFFSLPFLPVPWLQVEFDSRVLSEEPFLISFCATGTRPLAARALADHRRWPDTPALLIELSFWSFSDCAPHPRPPPKSFVLFLSIANLSGFPFLFLIFNLSLVYIQSIGSVSELN